MSHAEERKKQVDRLDKLEQMLHQKSEEHGKATAQLRKSSEDKSELAKEIQELSGHLAVA